MSVKVYYSTDAGAPTLTGEVGSLAALLHAVLTVGYGAKTPPGGWVSTGVVNNKVALHSTFAGATGHWLHVDDNTNAQTASVRGYESLDSLDGAGAPVNPVNPFPTVAQQSTAAWKKSITSDNTARPWTLIADESFFYFASEPSNAEAIVYSFGDIIPLRSGDAHHCRIAAGTSAATGAVASGHYDGGSLYKLAALYSTTTTGAWLSRAYDQSGFSVNANTIGDNSATTSSTGILGTAGPTYPNAANNALLLTPLLTAESATKVVRGAMPGTYQPLHPRPLAHKGTISGLAGFLGRTLFALNINSSGQVLFDVTGPWR